MQCLDGVTRDSGRYDVSQQPVTHMSMACNTFMAWGEAVGGVILTG